ncbi:hypothetical protein GGC65_003962 [Sphingopyxis sp. OAS728]|uniref:hypothetical protein n=1 Tax=Sphingopyxis sp. OAS728 TaxID=2663823 RepID=UPI00178AB3BF|nr:hypothetical protein [Sphingopyxis sp. OAS728]MBE1529506.1 hypothetical protein [Sphingopyxis sp. OAS728]
MANLDRVQQSRMAAPIPAAPPMQRMNERAARIADWVMENIPWTVAVPEWPDFHDRWPLLSRADLAEVEEELCRRGAALDTPGADLDAVAETLTGRPTYYTAAADWLTLNPTTSISDPEFVRLFGRLSRAELILAAIEHKRRVLRRL